MRRKMAFWGPLGPLLSLESPRKLVMPLFWKPYKSDVTQFIDSLKQRDPQLEDR